MKVPMDLRSKTEWKRCSMKLALRQLQGKSKTQNIGQNGKGNLVRCL